MKDDKPADGKRREFLKHSLGATAGAVAAGAFPMIVPSTVFGKTAPSNRINWLGFRCSRSAA